MPTDAAFAKNYDQYLGPLLFEPFAEDIAERISNGTFSSVLEIACGTGRATRHIRRAIPSTSKLVATDSNADMIKVAAELVPDNNINWQTADAQQLIFPDESFDLVVCQLGLMFMPDKMKVVSEWLRVLKKGGKLIFSTWDKIENNGVIYLGNQIICSYFPENPPSFYRAPFNMCQPDQLETLLVSQGFRSVKVSAVEKVGTSPSAHDTAVGMVQGNPIYGRIIEKDPKLVDTITTAVEQKIGSVYGERPLTSPLRAWVVEAKK